MLGDLTWGDVHHPSLSETNGDYDGRWLFVNDMNGRVARIDLRDFKTRQIIGPVPNVSGNHGSAFVTPNTEYSVMASRFSIPIPKGTVAEVAKYATDYKGVLTGIKIDPKTGEMSIGWQILMPPFDYDLGDAGKLVSNGWVFFTCYNAERATGKLEITSAQRDRDYIAAVDWKMAEQLAAKGEGQMIGGVKVIDPAKNPGLVYFMPMGKSPHGVDVAPDGKYIIGSGKLQGVTVAFNWEKVQTAIRNKDFAGDEDGIPVLKYESIKDAEVAGGPGAPAHPVRARRLRLHLALRGQRHRQVEARHLGGGGQGPHVLLHRPPDRRRGRHREPRRQVPGGPQQALPRPPPLGGPLPARGLAARGHLRGEDEAPPRLLHRARAPLRADREGRQAQAHRGLSQGGEQAPPTRSGT